MADRYRDQEDRFPASRGRRDLETGGDWYGGRSKYDDDIDYRWEGRFAEDDEDDLDPTDRGYDEAAHNGASMYGVPEGRGGVFGTSGGGTYAGGFQVVERPTPYDRSGAPGAFEPGPTRRYGSVYGRDSRFDETLIDDRGHRGRGPKGYARSDARVIEDVNDRLTEHDQIDASEIEVKAENGEVTLTGSVPEKWMKRLAEDVTYSVSGVREVYNELKVAR